MEFLSALISLNYNWVNSSSCHSIWISCMLWSIQIKFTFMNWNWGSSSILNVPQPCFSPTIQVLMDRLQILPYICLTQYHISLRNSWRYRVCERGFMLKAVTEASLCADEREELWGSSLAIPDSPLKAESFSPDLFVEISGVFNTTL